jgi:hypothetical protein
MTVTVKKTCPLPRYKLLLDEKPCQVAVETDIIPKIAIGMSVTYQRRGKGDVT